MKIPYFILSILLSVAQIEAHLISAAIYEKDGKTIVVLGDEHYTESCSLIHRGFNALDDSFFSTLFPLLSQAKSRIGYLIEDSYDDLEVTKSMDKPASFFKVIKNAALHNLKIGAIDFIPFDVRTKLTRSLYNALRNLLNFADCPSLMMLTHGHRNAIAQDREMLIRTFNSQLSIGNSSLADLIESVNVIHEQFNQELGNVIANRTLFGYSQALVGDMPNSSVNEFVIQVLADAQKFSIQQATQILSCFTIALSNLPQLALEDTLKKQVNQYNVLICHAGNEYAVQVHQFLLHLGYERTFYHTSPISTAIDVVPTSMLPKKILSDLLQKISSKLGIPSLGFCFNCFICKTVSSLKRCSQCKQARYCNLACQTADWQSGHKELCQAA